MDQSTATICALCHQPAELQLSHFIPKFVFRWLKETSATKKFRHSPNVNVRAQDGVKDYLLCTACEQRFSRWEAQFADSFFRPIVTSKHGGFAIRYDSWLLMCLLSIHFRSILLQLRHPDPANAHWLPLLSVLLEDWRKRLLSDTPVEPTTEQHVFVLSTLTQHHPAADLPEGLNWYWMRGVDMTLATVGSAVLYSYVKLPGIVLLSALQPSHVPGMSGTRVRLTGRLSSPQAIENEDIGTFIIQTRPDAAWSKLNQISPNQRQVIAQDYKKNFDTWETLPSFDVGLADAMLAERRKRS